MPVQSETCENSLKRLRGRVARSRSIGTKLTPDEEQQILSAAQAQGKALSEWVRDVLLPRRDLYNRQRNGDTSIITLKPAIRYQFKTGQRDWPKT